MPFENEHMEIYETFHTEVAWHVARSTCDLRATPGMDLPVLFAACDVPPRAALSNFNGAFTSKVIIIQDNIKLLNSNNKRYNKRKTFGCMAYIE